MSLLGHIKVEKKQEPRVSRDDKNRLIIETPRPLSEFQVAKLTKGVMKFTKPKSVDDDRSRKEQIEEFLGKYDQGRYVDASVKTMRHIIPLLLMDVYSDKHGNFTKKVKGLWEKRPVDWPVDVPFVDPNNNIKDDQQKNCKPKKELLGRMLTYLMKRYVNKTNFESPNEAKLQLLPSSNDPMVGYFFTGPNIIDLQETDETAEMHVAVQNLPTLHSNSGSFSDSLTSSGIYNEDLHCVPTVQDTDGSITRSSMSTGHNSVGHGAMDGGLCFTESNVVGTPHSYVSDQLQPIEYRPPEQVIDSEEGTLASGAKDWNPVADLKNRICWKLNHVQRESLVPDKFLVKLQISYELAVKPLEESRLSVEEQLELLHKVELFMDQAQMNRSCADKNCQILHNLHDKLKTKGDQMCRTEAQPLGASPEDVLPRQDTPFPAEEPSVLTSLNMTSLNIKPRQVPCGLESLPPTGELRVRCLTREPDVVFGKSSLSENYKPVALAEESNQLMDVEFCFDGDLEQLLSGITNEPIEMLNSNDISPLLSEVSESQDTGAISQPVQESVPIVQPSSGNSELPGRYVIFPTSEASGGWLCTGKAQDQMQPVIPGAPTPLPPASVLQAGALPLVQGGPPPLSTSGLGSLPVLQLVTASAALSGKNSGVTQTKNNVKFWGNAASSASCYSHTVPTSSPSNESAVVQFMDHLSLWSSDSVYVQPQATAESQPPCNQLFSRNRSYPPLQGKRAYPFDSETLAKPKISAEGDDCFSQSEVAGPSYSSAPIPLPVTEMENSFIDKPSKTTKKMKYEKRWPQDHRLM